MKKFLVTITLFFAFCAAGLAQDSMATRNPTAQMWGEQDRMIDSLKLSAEQMATWKSHSTASRQKMTEIRESREMDREVKRAEILKLNDEQRAFMKGMLTPAQFTSWEDARQRRLEARRRGPGA